MLKMQNVTYFDRNAKVVEIGRKGTPTRGVGERVAILLWVDDADERNGGHPAGTIVADHIKGDGRRLDFQRFAEETFTDLNEALNWAGARLGTRVATN